MFCLIFTSICFSVLEKQRMAYKLEKFGVNAECILITSNKAVCFTIALQQTVRLSYFNGMSLLTVFDCFLFVSGSGL